MIIKHLCRTSQIGKSAFVTATTAVFGEAKIGRNTKIIYGAAMQKPMDIPEIFYGIGKRTVLEPMIPKITTKPTKRIDNRKEDTVIE